MASAPRRRRRWSRDLPPDLSDLMKTLDDYAALFIKGFGKRESEMREIIREFKKISDEVRENTDRDKIVGAVAGAAGGAILALGLLAAPFTGGLSLAATVAGGGAAVGAAVGAARSANTAKRQTENKSVKKVEDLGKQFMETVEPLKEILEEIKTTCEKLEQKKTEVQAGNTLMEVEEFQRILRRVSDLGKSSGEALDEALTVLERIYNLLRLVIKVLRVSATPKDDRELTESIMQSADQCQKVFDNFNKMKKELQVFIETTD